MGKGSGLITPRIFISHAWEDKELVRRLEKALSVAGAEVWVDHAGVRGGDNLPKRINDALAWCNTLLLVWSKAAEESHWVELEWTNAISLQKRIIPCPHDGTPPPPILTNKAYINFANAASGLRELLVALQLKLPNREARDKVVALAKKSAPIASSTASALQLRSQRLDKLSGDAVKTMLWQHDFYCAIHDWSKGWSNSSGQGIKHNFEARHNGQVVVDHVTGLFWQQSGSSNNMRYQDAEKYIRDLNAQRFADYEDWCLPTLEETMSLMESRKKDGGLYIDPVFDQKQSRIWTADKERAARIWCVYFDNGVCVHDGVSFDDYVRAVRS